MITAAFIKNSARMELKLNGKTGHTFGQISRTELRRGTDVLNMNSICKACKERLHLNTDRFQSSKVK